MTKTRPPPIVLVLLGFGLGALIIADRRPHPRAWTTSRERAIEAQRTSARASQVARDLTAQWEAEELTRGQATSWTRGLQS